MNRATVAVIIGSLVVVFTAINLSFTVRAGSLARPPIYDDVVYLLDAYQRLAFGGVNSLATLVDSFLSDPPHAPMSTLTAMLGYSLLGPSAFAAYAANIWLLAAFAVATYLVARRNLDQIPSIAITALMLFAPASHTLITEFRPDMGGGVFLACALLCLLFIDYAAATRLQLTGLALLVVLAIMAKLSAVIATLPMLGLAAILGILRPGHFSRTEMAASARAAIFFVALATALLIPCVIVWGPNTYDYLYQVLILNRDMWTMAGGPLYHWTFNSLGEGGTKGLGVFLWIGLLSIAVDVCFSVPFRAKRDGYNAVAFYLVVVVLYCGIATFSQKSPWQGSFFFFPFLLATTLSLGRNLSRLGKAAEMAGSTILLAAAAVFLPAASYYQSMPGYETSGAALPRISNAVAAEVAALQAKGCKSTVFRFATLNPFPLNVEAVALSLAMNLGINIKPVNHLTHLRTVADIESEIDTSDFVILTSKLVPWLPGSMFSPQILAKLAADSQWNMIASASDYTVFARKQCR